MRPRRLLIGLLIVAFAVGGAGCALFPRPIVPEAPAVPPRRDMPAAAEQPCALRRLPVHPTVHDLEEAVKARAAALVECDARRQLAVDIHAAEHADQDAWLRALRPRASLLHLLNRPAVPDARHVED